MYNKKTVFWAACIGMLLFGIGLITLGSMAPDLKSKFALDDIAIGTLFSILPFGILGGSLVFGPICDRYGYKPVMVIATLGMFIGFQGIAWSSSAGWLKFLIFIFGFGAGMVNGATNAVVSDISKGKEGANLSLLGVFFGIGALGMPFVSGMLKKSFTAFQVVETVAWFTLAVALFFSFIRFPLSKKISHAHEKKNTRFYRESFLYFIAFYLFFQGSIESILNNWTTSYLMQHLSIEESKALYGLTLYVLGLTIMRLLIGSVFQAVKVSHLMAASLVIVTAGILLVRFSSSYGFAVTGLVLLGAGLAAGFPIMLGLAGNRYAAQSGTAFSIIFTIALAGNMAVNYIMGVVSKQFGIQHFTTVALSGLVFMAIFLVLIFRLPKKEMEEQPLITGAGMAEPKL